jgi:hypothetical protein
MTFAVTSAYLQEGKPPVLHSWGPYDTRKEAESVRGKMRRRAKSRTHPDFDNVFVEGPNQNMFFHVEPVMDPFATQPEAAEPKPTDEEFEYGWYDDAYGHQAPMIWWYAFGLPHKTAESAEHTANKSRTGEAVIVRRRVGEADYEVVKK